MSFAAATGPMRTAVLFSSESGPSGQLGENLSAQCIGPWVVFLSQEPVKLGDAEAWLAAVDAQVRGLRL